MTGTINDFLNHYGQKSKIVIWEHNTQVGDPRVTDIAKAEMVNLGQLVWEPYGEETLYIDGFGTYTGE